MLYAQLLISFLLAQKISQGAKDRRSAQNNFCEISTGFKIILGLLIPPTIAKLEFKTREELELMPQTEEELQVNQATNQGSSGHT